MHAVFVFPLECRHAYLSDAWRQCPYLEAGGRRASPQHTVFSILTTNRLREEVPPLCFIGRWACCSHQRDWRRRLWAYISAESLLTTTDQRGEKQPTGSNTGIVYCFVLTELAALNHQHKRTEALVVFNFQQFYSKLYWTEYNDARYRSRDDPGGFSRREFRLQTVAQPRTLEWRTAPSF